MSPKTMQELVDICHGLDTLSKAITEQVIAVHEGRLLPTEQSPQFLLGHLTARFKYALEDLGLQVQ